MPFEQGATRASGALRLRGLRQPGRPSAAGEGSRGVAATRPASRRVPRRAALESAPAIPEESLESTGKLAGAVGDCLSRESADWEKFAAARI